MSSAPRLAAARALVSELTAGRWDARALVRDPDPEVDALLVALHELADKVTKEREARADSEAHVEEITEVIFRLAVQDFEARAPIRDDGSSLDGIAGGINMLAEELAASTAAGARRTTELHHKTGILESVFASLAEGVIVADEQGTFLMINQAARRMLGIEAESTSRAAQEAACDFLLPDGITAFPRDAIPGRRALLGEATEGVEMRVRRRNTGEDVFIRAAGKPLTDEAGVTRGAVAVFRDVTSARRVEAEKIAREAAEAASTAKSSFLANMSHEIRTPLNGVIGMTDLLLGTVLTAEQHQYAEAVGASANMLLDLIGDVLDFSKIEAGKMELERWPFDLRATLGDAMKILAAQARKKGLAFRCVFAADIPEELVGDDARLRQVALNLVGNALKFTERGEVVLEVSTEWAGASEVGVHVRVRDTGIGIPQDKREAIFDSFVQADSSTTRRFGGTGLGLAISSKLVALMGGTLRVDSEVGRGSEFHFTVRLGRGKGDAAKPGGHRGVASLVPQAPTSSGAATPLRVLLAEDNRINQMVISRILTNRGHSVVVVGDGRAAVAAIEGGAFDLVLMDIQMPELSGIDATTAVRTAERATGRHVPIVALTAHAMKSDREACLAVGMDAYVTKPVRAADLFAAIERVTRGTAASYAPDRVSDPATPRDLSVAPPANGGGRHG